MTGVFSSVSGESSEQSKASRVSLSSNQQAEDMQESFRDNYQFNPCLLWIYVTIVVCVEVQPTGEGDVHCLSEDGVPAGETDGSAACLPQKLLPLCSLQHKAQVSLLVP